MPLSHAFTQCISARCENIAHARAGEGECAHATIVMLILQAQVEANKGAEVAKAAIQAAQEQATSNEARAVEAEQKLAAEVAAHSDADAKFVDLEVCIAT